MDEMIYQFISISPIAQILKSINPMDQDFQDLY